MPEGDRKGAEIRRMAVQKSAAEIVRLMLDVGALKPPAKTDKTGLDKMLSYTRQVIDWLDTDVVDAGDRAVNPKPLTSGNGAANVVVDGENDGLSLDEAMDLLDQIGNLDPADKAGVKAKMEEVGVRVLKNPRDTVLGMTKPQASAIYKHIKDGK